METSLFALEGSFLFSDLLLDTRDCFFAPCNVLLEGTGSKKRRKSRAF
jgi:hypothetical protein